MKAPFNNIERTPYYIQRGRNGSSYPVCNSLGIVMAIFQDPMDAEVYLSLKNGRLAMIPKELLEKEKK